jgi:hypothetical protein
MFSSGNHSADEGLRSFEASRDDKRSETPGSAAGWSHVTAPSLSAPDAHIIFNVKESLVASVPLEFPVTRRVDGFNVDPSLNIHDETNCWRVSTCAWPLPLRSAAPTHNAGMARSPMRGKTKNSSVSLIDSEIGSMGGSQA